MLKISKLITGLIVGASLVSLPANAAPRVNCEANLIETNKAIEGAMQSVIDARKAGTALGVGGGCALISIFLLGMDAGMTSVACAVLTAGTYATLTVEERREISNRVFNEVRDRRCIK